MEFSVVMVAHGAWDWTRQALAALAQHTPEPHEVVVVDNASPDGTVEQLAAEFPGARVIANAENLGFGPATNQGVAVATAAVIVLLNTDALVRPGWARPLLDALAREDVVGAAPMLLHLDGRLQEAGVLLARDGSVAVYGDGEDAEDPAYGFPRHIDYASAACLALRRDAYLAVGGFDDRYAPAYYEDADLGMALAAHGGRIVYVPGSRVQHARYGSGTPEAAQELSERNRRQFAERWVDTLSTRPPSLAEPSMPLLLAARDAIANPRVLVAGSAVAEAGTLAAQVLQLRTFARVTLLVDDPTNVDAWLAQGIEVAAPADLAVWLADRPGFYDLVIAGEGTDPAAFRAGQLQAVLLDGLPSVDALDGALADAGV
jgi:GT2 family glycosyltransferase